MICSIRVINRNDTPDMALPWSCHLIQARDVMTPQTIQTHHIQYQQTKNGGIVIRSHHVQNKVPNQDRFLTLDEILNSCWADHLGFGLERGSHDYVLSYIGIELKHYTHIPLTFIHHQGRLGQPISDSLVCITRLLLRSISLHSDADQAQESRSVIRCDVKRFKS